MARFACALAVVVPCAAGSASAAETIRLTVVGGAQAGTWRAERPKDLCAVGYSRPGEWSVRYAVDGREPKRLSSLQLFVPAMADGASPTPAGTQMQTRQFDLSLTIGPLRTPTARHEVETRVSSRRPQGTGVVTIDDRGRTARVSFDATTKDRVKLRGVVECRAVLRSTAS